MNKVSGLVAIGFRGTHVEIALLPPGADHIDAFEWARRQGLILLAAKESESLVVGQRLKRLEKKKHQ